MFELTWIRLHLFPYNPWKDSSKFDDKTPADRRRYILDQLENSRTREWLWAVAVAGVGFLTDAYNIFSIGMVMPMIVIIYDVSHTQVVAINIATLGGSIIGQTVFGIAADIWGRRKLYGLELIITIGAALGSAMSSTGYSGSMSLIGWLIFWRLILGIGIGADYPLSAVICSEMAPTRLRGMMLTAVFACQPLGQLLATLAALVVTVAARDSLQPKDQSATNIVCDDDCKQTLDMAWRLLLGLGAVPAAISLWFRLTIIESPRYTAEVVQNDLQAAVDVDRYFFSSEHNSAESIELSRRSHSSDAPETDLDGQESTVGHTLETTLEFDPPMPFWAGFVDYFCYKGNYRTLLATSLCWLFLDLPFFGLGMNDSTILNTIWSNEGFKPQSTVNQTTTVQTNVTQIASGQPAFYKTMFGHPRNQTIPANVYDDLLANSWQSLLIVSLGAVVGVTITLVTINKLGRRAIQINGFFWLFILFVVLGASFKKLMDTGRSSAIVVLYILTQIFFNFGPNTTTYIIAAEVFPTRYRCTGHGISAAAGKLGAVIAQCFLGYLKFNIQAKPQATYDDGYWVGYALLVFSLFMLIGLLLTVYWIPVSHDKNGRTLSLEELAQGRTVKHL